MAGTVPVYFGADNIDFYDPMYGREGPRSIIKVSDFKSVPALIEYLRYLASNETAYMQYYYWRSLPPTDHFTHLVSLTWESPRSLCLLCKAVLDWKQRKNIPL